MTFRLRTCAGAVLACAVTFAWGAPAHAQPAPPNCSSADLTGTMTGVMAATTAYLYTHPPVNEFFSTLQGRSQEERKAALEAFYDGPTWQAHRDAANATMIDSDDVHLLRAIAPEGGLPAYARLPRLGERSTAIRYTLLLSELRYSEWVGQYHLWLRLFLRNAGADPVASFATLPAENTYRRLPVWTNRHVHLAVLKSAAPIPRLPVELRTMLKSEPERIVVSPTARSRLR